MDDLVRVVAIPLGIVGLPTGLVLGIKGLIDWSGSEPTDSAFVMAVAGLMIVALSGAALWAAVADYLRNR